MKKRKSELEKAGDVVFTSALSLQGIKVLKDIKTGTNLANTATGFVNLGIAGATYNMSKRLVYGSYSLKKKRVKKRR